jgi:hypothetical protein
VCEVDLRVGRDQLPGGWVVISSPMERGVAEGYGRLAEMLLSR